MPLQPRAHLVLAALPTLLLLLLSSYTTSTTCHPHQKPSHSLFQLSISNPTALHIASSNRPDHVAGHTTSHPTHSVNTLHNKHSLSHTKATAEGLATLQQRAQRALQGAASQPPQPPPINRTLMDIKMRLLKQSILIREKRLPSFPDTGAVLPLTYLAMCAVIKDDGKLLREWIQYHHEVLGVKRFYVFDNNSTYPALAVAQLQGWIRAGVVVYEYFTYTSRSQGGKMPQHYAVQQCVQRWADHHEWMAFMDPDEFVVLKGSTSPQPPITNRLRKLQPQPQGALELFLSQYEGAGGLSINVVNFGSGGRVQRPAGVIGYYNECAPVTSVKTIANMHFYSGPMIHPHNHLYILGAVAVNEDGGHVPFSDNSPAMTRRVVLYHYYLRSKQDWARKIRRGRADCVDCGARDWAWYEKVTREIQAHYNPAQCLDLDKYRDKFTRNRYSSTSTNTNTATGI